MHALEKLWKAAYVFHAEGSLEADLWVLDRTLRVLSGDVGQVVKGIRQSITKRGFSGANRLTLEGVADYLYRNRTRMRYDEYLAKGWPIASGPVEGACKHLIKDRMERSGMRWTEQMAEAIVQLRAIYLSGDFDQYWQFHIDQDQKRLYPASWSVVRSSHTQIITQNGTDCAPRRNFSGMPSSDDWTMSKNFGSWIGTVSSPSDVPLCVIPAQLRRGSSPAGPLQRQA